MGGVEGGGRKLSAARLLEVVREAWRERTSERRALAAPKVVPETRLARSRLAAAIDARLAVRAGVRLEDFLRSRLARYAVRLPVALEELPIQVEIEAGEAVVRTRPPPRPAAGGAAGGPEQALGRREGPYAAREIRDAEAALDALDGRAAAARARIDELARGYAAALAAGAVAARPDLDATAEQLGRPPVPAAAPVGALRAFVAALLVAEAWQLSGPVLAASGLSPDGLEAALHATPLPAALALVFALGAAAAVFAFAAVALSRGADALDEVGGARRGALLGLGALAAALGAGGVAAAGTADARWARLVLLVAVPFAAAVLWRWAAHLARVRGGALDAALAWDRERAREATQRGRWVEAIATAEAELRELEAERQQARRRVRALQRRAIDAERQAAAVARVEAQRLDRLAEGLAAALEQDRYLYLRLSSERAHATSPRPVRAGRLENAVATDRLGIAS